MLARGKRISLPSSIEKRRARDNEREENNLRDLESLCAHVEDPRLERTTRHRWRDIIISLSFWSCVERKNGLNPQPCEASYVPGVQGMSRTVKRVVAMEGKMLRCSHDQGVGKQALHVGVQRRGRSNIVWSWRKVPQKRSRRRFQRFLYSFSKGHAEGVLVSCHHWCNGNPNQEGPADDRPGRRRCSCTHRPPEKSV